MFYIFLVSMLVVSSGVKSVEKVVCTRIRYKLGNGQLYINNMIIM